MKNFEFDNFYYHLITNCAEHTPIYYSNKLRASQYKLPIEISAKYLKKHHHVLDWSCGDGHFSMYLTYKQAYTIGSSFNKEGPENLKDNPYFQFQNVDSNEAVKLPFEAKNFDLVFSMGVLEHVHQVGGDQSLSLEELHRILKDDGKFLCFHFPNKYGWVERLVSIMPQKLRDKLAITHLHSKTYNYDEIQKLISKQGFRILEYGRYNFLPMNMTRHLPNALTNCCLFSCLFTQLDKLLTFLLPILCTQSYFVAEKINNDNS